MIAYLISILMVCLTLTIDITNTTLLPKIILPTMYKALHTMIFVVRGYRTYFDRN